MIGTNGTEDTSADNDSNDVNTVLKPSVCLIGLIL